MNTAEQIALIEDVKTRLLEKGWTQGTYGRDEGPNCLLGAARVVRLGHTRSYDVFVETGDLLRVSVLDEQLNAALGVSAAWFNDNAKGFNDVIEFLDTRVIALKEEL